MVQYKRLIIRYILCVLNFPRWIILVPAVVLFILSYNVLYEFSIKELNVRLASIFNSYYYPINPEYIALPEGYNFLTKITFCESNLLSLTNLNLVNNSVVESTGDLILLSPLNHIPIDLSSNYNTGELRSLQSYFLKFFNYDLNNRLPYLYFNNLTLVNDLIEKVSELSIYIIHSQEILQITSDLLFTTKTLTNLPQINNFVKFYNYQNHFGSIYHFVQFSNYIIAIIMGLYGIYIYIALANQHRVRSSMGLLISWLFLAFALAAASINITATLHGTSWKLIFEPSTTFTKLSYIFIVMIITANHLFKILSHVTNKLGKLHSQLLSFYIKKWNLPLMFPYLLVNVLSLLSLIVFSKIISLFLLRYLPGSSLLFMVDIVDLCCQTFIYCFVLGFLMESSYLIGIIIIDTKRIGLTEVMEAKSRENEGFFEKAHSKRGNIYDGGNIFSQYLLKMNTNLRPNGGFKFKLGQALLKVRYESNPLLMGFSILFLAASGFIHSILILPKPPTDIVDSTMITKINFSALYYLELTSILLFTLAISLLVFKLTESYTKDFYSRLDSSDFEVEKKVFNSIELDNGHDLDIIKVITNPNTSFVISMGLDHKVFIWSPLAKNSPPINIETTFTINKSEDLDNQTCGHSIKQSNLENSYFGNSVQDSQLSDKIWQSEDQSHRSLDHSSKTIPEESVDQVTKDKIRVLVSSDDLSSLKNDKTTSPVSMKPFNTTSPESSILSQITKEFWPINHVNISDDGNYIILLNQKYGILKCYERKQLKYIWEKKLAPELLSLIHEKKFKILKSFFRKKTVPSFLARKILQKKKLDGKSRHDSQVSLTSLNSTVNGNFPPPPPQKYIPSKEQLINDELDKLQKEEFVMLLETGHGLTINCIDGSTKDFNVLKSAYPDDYEGRYLVSARKIVTPRVNDRIVFQVANEEDLIIATAVNNNWKFRLLKVREGFYNQRILPLSQETGKIVNNNDFSAVFNSQVASKRGIQIQQPKLVDSKFQINKTTLVSLQFVGLIVRVKNLIAELIDIETGIILKSIPVGRFKAKSFRVSHSEPTHCKFCGCASIHSFSIVYEDYDTPTIIIHSFKIDLPKSKNNICLRVERDPREIRCIGFNAVTEHQYWYENIEGWELTDVNMIIGIKKVNEPEIIVNESSNNKVNFNQLVETSGLQSLRNRKYKRKIRTFTNHVNNNNKKQQEQQSTLWEGFIINASDGKLINYELPKTKMDRINFSTNKINCIEKYGYKSIIVNICNILEIFYLGNDKLIEDDIYYSGNKADVWSRVEDEANKDSLQNRRPDQTINSELLFINKRRKMRDRSHKLPI